jgi:hypothetical protein
VSANDASFSRRPKRCDVFGQCPECAQPGNLAVHRTIRRNAIGLEDACPLRLIEVVSLGHAGSLAIGVWLHLRKPTYRDKKWQHQPTGV